MDNLVYSYTLVDRFVICRDSYIHIAICVSWLYSLGRYSIIVVFVVILVHSFHNIVDARTYRFITRVMFYTRLELRNHVINHKQSGINSPFMFEKRASVEISIYIYLLDYTTLNTH
jgi:hypothetical protein